jgi:hypothetical protein
VSPRIRVPILVALLVAAGIVTGVVVDRARGRLLREAILAELLPVALTNCAFRRFGGANDAGYLMCENLIGTLGAAYSYGVGYNDDWGCDVSRAYQVPVHQYDCYDPNRPACPGGTFIFHDECVADRPRISGTRVFDTLENQIARNGDRGRRLLVKMDIEGAEWDALLAAPDDLLMAIPQVAMEMHGYDDPKILEALRKLKRHFFIVNLHFNNWACTPEAAPLRSWAYQVLLVNKEVGVLDPSVSPPAPMSLLNAPDARSRPDCQLEAR